MLSNTCTAAPEALHDLVFSSLLFRSKIRLVQAKHKWSLLKTGAASRSQSSSVIWVMQQRAEPCHGIHRSCEIHCRHGTVPSRTSSAVAAGHVTIQPLLNTSPCGFCTAQPQFTPLCHHVRRRKESNNHKHAGIDLPWVKTALGEETVKISACLVKTKVFLPTCSNFGIKFYPRAKGKPAIRRSHTPKPRNLEFLYFPTNKRQRALLAPHLLFPSLGWEPGLAPGKEAPTTAILGSPSLLCSATPPQTPSQVLFNITSEVKVEPKRKYF